MTLNKVAVIGAGTMGASIALAIANNNLPVVLKDVDEKAVESGLSRIDRMLASLVRKGMSEDEAKAKRSLIEPSVNSSGLNGVTLAIEAVPEVVSIKKAVLSDLDDALDKRAIIATNTSSLPITQLAKFTKRPNQVVGLHFFNPAHLMKLVEVIPGLDTDEATVEAAMTFVRQLGKLPVRVEECASFLVNRLLGRYMNESLFCLQEGAFGVEEIDKAVCDFVMPIGPFALRDMNGADIGLAVARFNYQEYGQRFSVPPLLESMVEHNFFGQKTGLGFYKYDSETKKKTGVNPELAKLVGAIDKTGAVDIGFHAERVFLPMINEAFLALQERVCKLEDLDLAMKAGLGMRQGPLEMASNMGLSNCLLQMEELFKKEGERFRPAPLLKRYVWAGRKNVS